MRIGTLPQHTFKLSKEFLNNYKDKQPEWGPLGFVTYKRTYARPKPNGTTEEYWETIKRVVEGIYTIQLNHYKENMLPWDAQSKSANAEKMYDAMWNFKFTPPGRGLWAMGTDLIWLRGSAALNNCFSGDTKFYTDKGTVCFKDVVNKTVNVLTKKNTYKPAKVKNYGKQELQTIILKPKGLRSNYNITYDVTFNHRWILSDNKITTSLQKGDVIKISSKEFKHTAEYDVGFAHGLIFGDGTRHTYYPERHFIRLCTSNKKELAAKLQKIPGYISTTSPESYNGDLVVTIKRENENWKDLPKDKSDIYIAGFMKGWIEADAWTKPAGNICLDTQSSDAANWVLKEAPRAGYNITGYSIDNNETNYGYRKNPLNRISLTTNAQEYIVSDIIKTGNVENVYCVEEPETQTFTLEYGIPTGNCAFVTTEDLHKNPTSPFLFMMDMSMLGVGVGGDTKGAGCFNIQKPKVTETVYKVEDTREGWVKTVEFVLNGFFEGSEIPVFDYSLIRPAGSPLVVMGGTAPGPQPLIDGVKNLIDILTPNIGKPISEELIVDIFNFVGKCVVSGGIRRTAQIMFGEPNSKEYLSLKDPETKSVELMDRRWASNNSVFGKIGMSYKNTAKLTAKNGEPGYIWLQNMQNYGRMKDTPDYKDINAKGSNPCSEQTLESYELCCLVETYPVKHKDAAEYYETLKLAHEYAKTVTLIPTHNEITNKVMMKNRRMGVSMSGITQAMTKFGRRNFFAKFCDEGYNILKVADTTISEEFAIPKSIKLTSVKPSGTVSLLAGVTPGIHYPQSEYYIRRIRYDINSNQWKVLKRAGYNVEKSEYGDNTMVVEFPVKEEYFDRSVTDVSMWEQLENTAQMQYYWADNQVSVTINFNEEEAKDIQKALELYESKLKSVSFLPISKHGYKQAPYEPITKKEYEEKQSVLKPFKFTSNTHDSDDEFCDSGKCLVQVDELEQEE